LQSLSTPEFSDMHRPSDSPSKPSRTNHAFQNRMRLTLVFPDGREEVVGDYRTKAEARLSFAACGVEGVRGRIDSLSGVLVCEWLPLDPDAEVSKRKAKYRSKKRTEPLRKKNVNQESIGDKIMVTAWGETKSVFEWSRDPRAAVPWSTIRSRLVRKKRWKPEDAISKPSENVKIREINKEKHSLEAFGERKTINEWSADPRCEVGAHTLRVRLKRGAPLELALRREVSSEYKKWPTFVGFGEVKSAKDWANDARCTVSHSKLCRLLRDGLTVEQIFERHSSQPATYHAFGEVKPLKDWVQDERCVVSRVSVLNRISSGYSFEEAISTPASIGPCARVFTAFGETKSFKEWLSDSRCTVSRVTVLGRLSMGIPFENAISVGRGTKIPDRIYAFGESKTLYDWLGDPRCVVSEPILKKRLKFGMEAESALTTPASAEAHGARGPKKYEIEAFGERKSAEEWYMDVRCEVSFSRFKKNLASGMVPEVAMRKWARPSKPLGRLSNLGKRLGSLSRRCDQACATRDLHAIGQLLVELERTLNEARSLVDAKARR
jgi:hypothetical protein